MEAEETLVTVFGGIFAVLALASLLGLALKWGISPQTPHATLDNLNARLGAWWMMIILLALAFWGGKPTLIILFALVSFQCLREFVPLTRVRSGDHRVLLWCFLFFLPLQYSLVAVDWYALDSLPFSYRFTPFYCYPCSRRWATTLPISSRGSPKSNGA